MNFNLNNFLKTQYEFRGRPLSGTNPFEQQEHVLSKIKLINSEIIDEFKSLIKKCNVEIDEIFDKIEKIDVDRLRNNFEILLQKSDEYNKSIDNWFDDSFELDKKILMANIQETNIKSQKYIDNDYLCFMI